MWLLWARANLHQDMPQEARRCLPSQVIDDHMYFSVVGHGGARCRIEALELSRAFRAYTNVDEDFVGCSGINLESVNSSNHIEQPSRPRMEEYGPRGQTPKDARSYDVDLVMRYLLPNTRVYQSLGKAESLKLERIQNCRLA
jgi:hypothetical protein